VLEANPRAARDVSFVAKGLPLVERIEQEFLVPLDADSRETLYRLLSRLASYHDNRFPAPADPVAVAT
jgi:hypothetical protein